MSWVKDTFFGGREEQAAQDQIRAGRDAIASNERALETARGDLAPFRGAGQEALNPLLEFVLAGPEQELERSRGFRDIQTSAAAGGKLRSGETLEELTGFNNMLNARNRNQTFNELFNLVTLGSNAAAGQATATLNTAGQDSNLITGIGNASAAGNVARGSATRGTLFDIGRIAAGI